MTQEEDHIRTMPRSRISFRRRNISGNDYFIYQDAHSSKCGKQIVKQIHKYKIEIK